MPRTKKTNITNILKYKSDNSKCVEWNGMNINIKNVLSVGEMYKLVESVVSACFTEKGEYGPEAKNFAMRLGIIVGYTDVDVGNNIEEQYEMCYQTNIFDIVVANVSEDQLSAIYDAVEDKIEYLYDVNVQLVYEKFNDAANSLNGLIENIGDAFDGVNASDINNFIKNFGSADISGQKIIEAYIDKKYGTENT